MAWDEYTHPEFGLLCPTPRLRRELRIAVMSGLFGAVAGVAGVLALAASYPDTDRATVASARTADAPVAVPASNEQRTLSAGTDAPDIAGVPSRSSAASPAKTSPEPARSIVTEPQASAQNQATAAPDIARLPPGPRAASPADVSSNPTHSTVTEPQGPAQKQATAASPHGFDGRQDGAHSSALPAKPRQTSRSQNRERPEPARDWRAERAEPSAGRLDSTARASRLGNARDGTYARQGFWDWSR